MTIILIEGSDGDAKSSLAKELSVEFGYTLFKENISYYDRLKPDYDGFEYYVNLIKSLVDSKKNLVIDRLHIGEAVNPIVRKDGRPPLTLEQIHYLEQRLSFNSILILAQPSNEFTKNVFATRGEEIAKVEDIQYLHYLYKLFYDLSIIENKMIYNVEEDSSYEKIKAKLRKNFLISKTLV